MLAGKRTDECGNALMASGMGSHEPYHGFRYGLVSVGASLLLGGTVSVHMVVARYMYYDLHQQVWSLRGLWKGTWGPKAGTAWPSASWPRPDAETFQS